MRLTDLDPTWWVQEGFGAPASRTGMGVTFLCPVHRGDCCMGRIAVPFANPIDGGPPSTEGSGEKRDTWWVRSGAAFETLTLSPSIDVREKDSRGAERSHWHGHVQNGEVT